MPVTLNLCETEAVPFPNDGQGSDAVEDLFVSTKLAEERKFQKESSRGPRSGAPNQNPYKEVVVKSELSPPLGDPQTDHIYARDSGLVHALEAAYSNHHHLVLRPDDVWICLLTQFSIYVNKNAEELRDTFVDHEGCKT